MWLEALISAPKEGSSLEALNLQGSLGPPRAAEAGRRCRLCSLQVAGLLAVVQLCWAGHVLVIDSIDSYHP